MKFGLAPQTHRAFSMSVYLGHSEFIPQAVIEVCSIDKDGDAVHFGVYRRGTKKGAS